MVRKSKRYSLSEMSPVRRTTGVHIGFLLNYDMLFFHRQVVSRQGGVFKNTMFQLHPSRHSSRKMVPSDSSRGGNVTCQDFLLQSKSWMLPFLFACRRLQVQSLATPGKDSQVADSTKNISLRPWRPLSVRVDKAKQDAPMARQYIRNCFKCL